MPIRPTLAIARILKMLYAAIVQIANNARAMLHDQIMCGDYLLFQIRVSFTSQKAQI